MSFALKSAPANVQITITDTNGECRRVISLMEGESIPSMGRKLSMLQDNNLVVRSVKFIKAYTIEDYINEWKKLVSEDKTTDSLENWYRNTYL